MNRKPSKLLIAFLKLTGAPMAYPILRPKVYLFNEKCSKELPKPCILMSNHKSLIDFVLYLFVFFGRNIRFLMAEVLFNKGKLFSWFLYKLGGIHVDRDGFDFSFVGESLEALEKGETIGIFPESRLPVNGKGHPFKPSVVFIALRTDAPIVPIYTNGCYLKKSRARVMIGEPIYLKEYCNEENPSQEELARLTALLEGKVNELKEELERRIEQEHGKKK